MDSSNSGSFQSSSGGGGGGAAGDNDEYDSRTQSISSFFNNPNLHQLLHQPPPLPPPSYHNPSPTLNYTPIQDPGSSWTGPTRPDFISYPTTNPKLTPRGSDHHQIGVTIKNPKKRTRASRRAPTTVLTTDTTNFRQMVQEFTGIPTAPFTTAPFSRRLDLLGRGGGGGGEGSFRPSFLNSVANIVESGGLMSSNNNNTTTAAAATTSGNYQFAPCNMNEFQKQPSNFLDLQNPMLSFQSLLQNSSVGQDCSSKRWRDQNGKMESFEGVIGNSSENVGGSKLNSETVLVTSRSGGDQVQGSEGGNSWICPSS